MATSADCTQQVVACSAISSGSVRARNAEVGRHAGTADLKPGRPGLQHLLSSNGKREATKQTK